MIKLSKKQSQQSLLAIAGVWFVYGLAGDSDGSIWLFVVAGFAAPWFGTVKRLFKEHYDQTGQVFNIAWYNKIEYTILIIMI